MDSQMTPAEMSWETALKALATLQRGAAAPAGVGKNISTGDINGSVAAIGDGAQVIIVQALSAAEQARQKEDSDQHKLALAVAERAEALREESRAAPQRAQAKGNPYKYLRPHELVDFPSFFGRDALVERLLANLTCRDSLCRLAVLHGDAGMGKSSLVGAGIMPELVAGQHLPLFVRVTGEPLGDRIKQALLRNLETTEYLKGAPLHDFIRQAASLLPEGKRIFILLDQFETFFETPASNRGQFIDELERCLFDSHGRDHWLLSLRSAFVGHLSTFEPVIPFPAANSLALPPLTGEDAQAAILNPARLAGIAFADDLLPALLSDLGRDTVDPARLQLVCYTLAAGLAPGARQVTLKDYERVGRTRGILRDHLQLVLKHNLPPEDRPSAWQVLATIAEAQGSAVPVTDLVDRLRTYSFDPAGTRALLRKLENNWLVRSSDQRYYLASESLLAPLKEWSRQRAALAQARAEGLRQLERVRGSALRGLLGGMLGFSLAYLLAFATQFDDRFLLLPSAAYRSLPGALAGLLLVLFVDVALASYHGPHRRLRWLAGGLAGAAGFSLALLLHALLNSVNEPLALVRVGLEGALWGAAAGLGTVWYLSSRRPRWQILPLVAAACGLVLWVTEPLGQAFQRPRLPAGVGQLGWLVAAAGALMPALIMLAAAFGRAPESEEPF